MKRSLLALLALALLPSFAFAANPGGLKAQAAKAVRQAAKAQHITDLKVNGRSLKTRFENGDQGGFSGTAAVPGPAGLRGTSYTVGGDFAMGERGFFNFSNVKIQANQVQPRTVQ